jgi:hypothetical protein
MCKKGMLNVVDRRFATCEDPLCPFVERFDKQKHVIKETRNGMESR